MILRILNIIRIISNKHAEVGNYLRTHFDSFIDNVSTLATLNDNTKLFSNAMGSEKKSDRYENSQEYKNYYSNGNQYTPDSYYYYEQMNQYQPQQQQQSYDNNYGYDNNKKISYSDSYEDMKNI